MKDVADRLPAPRWLQEGERKRDQATLLLRGAAQLLRELAKETTDRPLTRHTNELVEEYAGMFAKCDELVADIESVSRYERRKAERHHRAADLRVLTDAGVDVFADRDPGDENDHHSRRVPGPQPGGIRPGPGTGHTPSALWRGVYPGMCVDPEICRGKSHCPRDYACNH